MRVRGWVLSDVGRKRDHNEDSFLVSDELGLYAVADGMGGHLGGERASRMAVEILEREIAEARRKGVLDAPNAAPEPGALTPVGAAMKSATLTADTSIFEMARADAALSGMGTTLTAMLFHGHHLTLTHVGDSRAFLYRSGHARQLTEDHSWIQEQVRAGMLSAEEAKESRFRNIITRSVGFEPSVEPDIITLAVEPGDAFMICSDGLSNYVGTEEIGQVLTAQHYSDAPRVFVDIANERGGEDNVTCLVVYVANEK